MVHEGEPFKEIDELLERKRRVLAKFGVKVFEDDKLMPLDGGRAQTKKLMAAYKDKEIKLSVLDKMEAGYPSAYLGPRYSLEEHAAYNRGKDRGIQTVHRLKKCGKELTVNTA